jgi:hypothetical protein
MIAVPGIDRADLAPEWPLGRRMPGGSEFTA